MVARNVDRPDRGIAEDQQRIHSHDGRIISLANDIDDRMTQVGTWLADGDLSGTSREIWDRQFQKKKRASIAALFPTGWHEGELLISRTRDCFNYRNSIGHSTLGLRFIEDGVMVWERRSSRGATEVSLDSLLPWETRLAVVYRAWTLIVYPSIPMIREYQISLEGVDLAGMLASDLLESDAIGNDDLRGAVAWLFPEVVDKSRHR